MKNVVQGSVASLSALFSFVSFSAATGGHAFVEGEFSSSREFTGNFYLNLYMCT